jgi:glycosyltransferase involved in cell wall biosynthesis
MRAYRLLVATYHWPPFSGPGASRWTALVKYLRRLGHEVTVITTPVFGSLASDVESGVVRTRDLAAVGGLRSLLRRPPAGVPAGAPVAKPAPSLLTRTLVPDPYVASWVPFAIATARRVLRGRAADCLITSSPPDSAHLVGLALGRARPAWVADFRDGWTFEPLRPPFPTGAQRRFDRRIEGRVVNSADAVVAATEPIARDLSDRYGIGATTIRNAWDPDLEAEVAAATSPQLETDRVNLVYTGSLGGIRGHDDRGLLSALRGIARDDPELAGRLRVVVAGSLTEPERRALSAPDLSPLVRLLGPLPHSEAVALQREAQALLLITSRDTSVSTAKLYEYLAADRPILALAGENEAARIVAETATGVVVAPDDVPGIREALSATAERSLFDSYAPRELERYRYPAPADGLIATIEEAVAARR